VSLEEAAAVRRLSSRREGFRERDGSCPQEEVVVAAEEEETETRGKSPGLG